MIQVWTSDILESIKEHQEYKSETIIKTHKRAESVLFFNARETENDKDKL